MIFVSFVGQSDGLLANGDSGRLQVTQKGLLYAYAHANENSRVALDAYPAERILISATGHAGGSFFMAASLSEICQNVKTKPANTLFYLVRIAGLEPARVAPLPPQSSVSANSTICAEDGNNEALSAQSARYFSWR